MQFANSENERRNSETPMKRTPQSAKMFVGLVAVCALAFLVSGLMRWESVNLVRFACFMVLTMAASRMKVSLPGLNGNMSVNLPFMLLAALELSLGEALLVAAASTAVQCLPKGGKRMAAIQVVFNISLIVNAIGLAHLVAVKSALVGGVPAKSVLMGAAALTFFMVNTFAVATILSLAEGANFVKTWKELALLTFPFFVLSAGLASMAATAVLFVGWQIPLAMFPVMAVTYASYKRYFATSRAETSQAFASSAAAD
jgi:hypothetical protein